MYFGSFGQLSWKRDLRNMSSFHIRTDVTWLIPIIEPASVDGLQVDTWVICCEENKSQSQNISAILWARGSAATSPPGEDESTILGDEQQAYDSTMWRLNMHIFLHL